MTIPKIGVIISSTREARFADKPAAWLMDKVKDHPELHFELIDLRAQHLPFFNEADTNLWVPSTDPHAVAWQDKLAGFDGFVFVLAEYNRSITGALKNALDQAYTEWNRKPFTALAYGRLGGARALEHLRLIGIELQMVPLRNAVHIAAADFFTVSPLGANAPLSEIEHHLEGPLRAMLDELTWWATLLRQARAG